MLSLVVGSLSILVIKIMPPKIPPLNELCYLWDNNITLDEIKFVEVGFLQNFIVQIWREIYFPDFKETYVKEGYQKDTLQTLVENLLPKSRLENIGTLQITQFTIEIALNGVTTYKVEYGWVF